MKYVILFVVSAFTQIYYCNGVLQRSFIEERTKPTDKDLEHSRPSRQTQFKSSGNDFADLENSDEPPVPLFGAHFLHGSTNGRIIQPQSNRQQQHQQDQQQQQKRHIKHHQCQQHQQKQRREAVKIIIANNRQMPKNNQKTGQAEQHMDHQHKPNYKLNRQYNNNNNANYHIDRSTGNNKRNSNKSQEVQGHHDQFGIMHENNQNNGNIKNNYHNNFKMNKTKNIIANINGDASSTPRSIPKLATATSTTKASATTATMKYVASTPSDQKVLPLKSMAGIKRTLASPSTPVQQPIPQDTKLKSNTSHFIVNRGSPTSKSARLVTDDMGTLHFRRSISNNPFLQNQPLRRQNDQTSTAEEYLKQTTFMQNPFLQHHMLPNPANQIPLVPNNESKQNPWLHNPTPKPTNAGYPYTPVAATNPFMPNFPVQTPSEPLTDRKPDPFMPFMPNFSFNPATNMPTKMSSQSVPAVNTSMRVPIEMPILIKSQTDENISSTPSPSAKSTAQSIVTSSSTTRAPTISPALSALIKKGAVIFPDSIYPTTTTSSAQLIDIRR